MLNRFGLYDFIAILFPGIFFLWALAFVVGASSFERSIPLSGGFSETNEELVERLKDYLLEAVNHELFTEEYFHLRNSGRATRELLKNSRISIIGCGALGSEIGNSLCKAGVGSMLLIDKEQFKSHNSIRHLLGLSRVAWPKSLALGEYLASHNPFVEVKINDVLANILSAEIGKYLPDTLSNEPSGTDIKSLAEIAE